MMKSSKGLTIGIVTLVTLGVLAIFLLKGSHESAEAASSAPPAQVVEKTEAEKTDLLAAPAAMKIDVATAMQDRVMGSENAPVTIIEYASLTCSHCAHFSTQVLPEVKKRLIDTGKAKLIFRDFPLDQFAIKASMMARCVSPMQYFNMIEVIFTNQDRWTKAKDPLESLAQLGNLAGMDEATFKSCTQNKELETALLSVMKEAQDKYQIRSTPTFIFNDGAEQLTGAQDPDKFEAIVKMLTKGK